MKSFNIKNRIDKFVLNKFPQYSRAYIKQQIKLGNILVYPVRNLPTKSEVPQSKPPASLSLQRGEQAKSPQKLKIRTKHTWTSNGLNGKKVKPSYILCEGDFVAFAPGFVLPTETKIQPNPDIKLKIIYEDANAIVIDKPAGLTVHPRQTKTGAPLQKETDNTLVSGLLAHCPPLGNVGDNPAVRPGIVHRLDKDTSGVMIVAKNQKSFKWLKKQFQERKVFKKYLALVCGQLKNDEGKIKNYLTRSESDPSKQKVVPLEAASTEKLREAITEYKIINRFKDCCLIEAYPKTGRLHQIRAQFAWLGFPVAGDTKYGPKKRPCPKGLNRQFLHAAELEILLPNGETMTFKSTPPKDLDNTLKNLEKSQV